MWGVGIASIGVITVIISLMFQFRTIDHGTSNQLTIDDRINTNVTSVLTGVSLFAVGYALWLLFTRVANKYLATFLIAFASLFISNIAVVLSLYQVTVTKV
jgi:hypothetical protein